MSPLKHSSNFAARMGRWSARHRKTAIFGWLAFVIASFAVGSVVGTKTIDRNDANVGEARKADHIIRDAGYAVDEQSEYVLVQSKTLTADEPAFLAVVAETLAALSRHDEVEALRSPLEAENAGQIAPDGHSALIQFTPRGSAEEVGEYIDRVVDSVNGVATANPGFYVAEAGSASTGKALDDVFKSQLERAGLISIPLTLVILLLVFGSVVAAAVPLLLALSAVLATMGLIAFPSQLIPVEESVGAIVLLIGLAVGVDYSLFYLRRERDERRAGRSETAALEAAAATSGRAVLISGFTVMIALAGMFLSGDKGFMSIAIGTIAVVGVAMIGSLTVLPAVLAWLGDRVEKVRVPLVHRFHSADGESRLWNAVLTRVLRRPVVSIAVAAGALLLLATPALGIHTSMTGLDALPKSMKEVESFRAIDAAFPGGSLPAIVAVKADDVTAAPVEAAITELKAAALATGRMQEPIAVRTSPDRTVAQVEIPLAGKGTDDVSNAALETLRNEVLPATLGGVEGVEYAVTGTTAASFDFNNQMKAAAPFVFGFVLLFAFLLLLAAFRSIVIAAKAILLNLLSVAAAYGILVAIFQWGWGADLLDFQATGGIAAWLPLFLFVILFGLSMDYHVFILSRIREAYDRGLTTEDAVSHGIRSTAGVVTSAAVVMVGVFLVFALMPIVDMKQMGIGLAAAVLIDATIIRGILLPAAMKLLGDWNWYLPRWLEWLPTLEHAEERAPEAAPIPLAEAA